MSSWKFIIAVSLLYPLLIFTVGCEPEGITGKGERVFLSPDFQPQQTLRYRFSSERVILTDWSPDKKDSSSVQESTESLEMIVSYEPVEVQPYGLSRIKATFDSVRVRKTGGRGSSGKDAAEKLTGKSYTFTVGPDGKIHDRNELINVLNEASAASLRHSQGGDIKDPDLLDDVLFTQWYLFDTMTSIEKPVEGLAVGQKWQSQQFVPNSMVLRKGRDVTYKLAEILEAEKGRIAVIESSYTAADGDIDVPLPYKGTFRLAGSFGFFRVIFKGLHVAELEGTGRELFNLDAGRMESYEQNYEFTLEPKAAPLPGAKPLIKIEQKITAELIEP